MRSTRNSNPSSKMKRINSRSTTCVDLFDSTELEYCCDMCRPRIDILSHSRKKKKTSNDISKRNKCERPWLMDYVTNNNKGVFHKKFCLHLDYPTDLKLDDECKCDKNKSSSISSTSKVPSETSQTRGKRTDDGKKTRVKSLPMKKNHAP